MVTGFSRVLFVTILLPITFMTLFARFQAHNTWYMKEWFFSRESKKRKETALLEIFQAELMPYYTHSKKKSDYHFEVRNHFLFGNWKTFFDILSNPMLFTWRTQITCVCPKITFYWLTHCPKSPTRLVKTST